MNLEIENAAAWSETIFGKCSLGDKRLTNRLIKLTTQLSKAIGSSLSSSCEGENARIEGSYRFIRNKRFTAGQIAEGGYSVTAYLAESANELLAIEDSTSLSYSHTVSEHLGYTSNNIKAKKRGYMVHSTMLMDAKKEKTIGLIAQERWCRDASTFGKRSQRSSTPYEEKESYKWEKNTHQLEKRLGNKIKDTISICDREADVYEYIQYKLEHEQRFIVRAMHNRKLADSSEHMFSQLADAKTLGSYTIEIAQKSNRKKREVEVELIAKKLTFTPPKRKKNAASTELNPLTLNVVIAREKHPSSDNVLEWVLLTTESISTFEEARKITRYYELRWRIEDFHKAWKSGAGAEKPRMQSSDNLEKMVVILSFLAIRLLQLKEYFEPQELPLQAQNICISCQDLLTEIEWKILWNAVEKKECPSEPPSAAWAYQAIAKLGGWSNSKRTGKAAWSTVWNGWFRLTERVEGFLLAQTMSLSKM
jgi:hypothetical protein